MGCPERTISVIRRRVLVIAVSVETGKSGDRCASRQQRSFAKAVRTTPTAAAQGIDV